VTEASNRASFTRRVYLLCFVEIIFKAFVPLALPVKLLFYPHRRIKRIDRKLATDVRKLGIFLNQLHQYIPFYPF
jgi:hypothetical protein